MLQEFFKGATFIPRSADRAEQAVEAATEARNSPDVDTLFALSRTRHNPPKKSAMLK